eukprot:175239-Chlamydomonas_euryale.AAC.2
MYAPTCWAAARARRDYLLGSDKRHRDALLCALGATRLLGVNSTRHRGATLRALCATATLGGARPRRALLRAPVTVTGLQQDDMLQLEGRPGIATPLCVGAGRASFKIIGWCYERRCCADVLRGAHLLCGRTGGRPVASCYVTPFRPFQMIALNAAHPDSVTWPPPETGPLFPNDVIPPRPRPSHP